MRIYNYLFYKSYLLAKRSKNFEDIPILGGIPFVALCMILNVFTLLMLVEGLLGFYVQIAFIMKYKYLFGVGLVVLLLLYYSCNGRSQRIVKYYEKKYRERVQLHPLIVIFLYYSISGFLIFLAAMFKNKHWIFAS